MPGQECQKENGHGPHNSTQGGQERIDRVLEGVQAATWKRCLGNLLGGDAKEKHHENVIDQEVQPHGVPE